MTDLIDTTEMYLRTVFELEEEGVVPLRARIAERLHHSGPTVSQTVARMARDGLLTVEGDRHLELTPAGRVLATRVMRKHRLAERLLVDVIGLEWEDAHVEACRWEHVISEAVEHRLVALLGRPTESPYGNPIPGLDELGAPVVPPGPPEVLESLAGLARGGPRPVVVRRIGEPLQTDASLMGVLRRVGAVPGGRVVVGFSDGGVSLRGEGETVEVDTVAAAGVFASADV